MINKTVEIFRKDVASGLKGMNVGIPGGLPKLDKKIKNIQIKINFYYSCH